MATSLNKVVEEVAKKQVEDLIVLMEMLSEQIIATSKTAKANQIQFATPSTSNGDMNKKLAESQTIIKKLQIEHNKLQDSYTQLAKKVDNYTTAKRNNTTAITNNSVAQSQLLKLTKEEEVLNTGLTTYIQKLSVERIRASRTVADYNAQIALGTKLTDAQTAELAAATIQFQKYDNAIKAGKASIGDAREYVGQYERANTGLSNSIGQIARELPSATFGFQTFALGISNNIPIAVDEIKKAVAANQDLIKKGQEIVPVWKQVGNALLSFNTIMSIGLLLLALYGKEIATFFKELTGGSAKINAVAESQKLLNEATIEGTKAVKDETVELKSNLAIAKDNNLSKKERLIAVDKIIQQYPFYFEGLTKEEILAGKTEVAEKKLTEALLARAKSTAAMNKIQSEQSKIIDIDENLYQLKIKLTNAEIRNADAVKNVIKVNRSRGDAEAFQAVQTAGNVEEIKRKIKAQEDEKKALTEVVDRITGYVIVNDKASIGLDYQTDKTDQNTKSIKLNTKAREDYLANEYELLHLRLTNVANANKDIMDDEASNFDLRLQASEQYYNNLIDLANMEAKEQLRVLEFSTNDRLRTIQNEYFNIKEQRQNELKEGKISRADYNKVMKDAEENLQYDRTGIIKDNTNQQNIIYENQAQNLINANKELVGQMRKAWDEINFQKGSIEIGNVELKGIQELGNMLSEIGNDMTIEQIQRKLQEINNISKESANDINRREAEIQLERAIRSKERIELEIRENGVINNLSEEQINEQLFNNKALQDADAEIIASKKRVAEADNAKTQQEIDNLLRVKEEERRFNDAVYEGRIELYNSIKDLGSQLFENQISDYDRQIEKSNEYYDSLLANAEAGSEQEQLLQEEKERKENELQQRKIALQRRQALFNKLLAVADIGIKLQQEIANNNATFPFPANQAINALSIASAGVRLATVLSTPLPQYEKGRLDGPEETALINEKRIEPVESKDGKVRVYSGRNRIVNLKAGDIVHKSLEDFQKNKMSLENASIMASFVNQANQLQAFDNYLGKELNGLSGKIEKGIEKGFKKAKINNNNQINFDFGRKPSNFFN